MSRQSVLPVASCPLPLKEYQGPQPMPEALRPQAMGTPNLDKLSKFSAHWIKTTKVQEITEAIREFDVLDAWETHEILKALFDKSNVSHVFQEVVDEVKEHADIEEQLEEQAAYGFEK